MVNICTDILPYLTFQLVLWLPSLQQGQVGTNLLQRDPSSGQVCRQVHARLNNVATIAFHQPLGRGIIHQVVVIRRTINLATWKY